MKMKTKKGNSGRNSEDNGILKTFFKLRESIIKLAEISKNESVNITQKIDKLFNQTQKLNNATNQFKNLTAHLNELAENLKKIDKNKNQKLSG